MKLEDVILRGTRASQPLATAVPVGTLYFVTAENVTERSNGTTWDSYADGGTGGSGGSSLILLPLIDPDPPDEPMIIPGPPGATGATGAPGGGGSSIDPFLLMGA
jgi:hypothetical protein